MRVRLWKGESKSIKRGGSWLTLEIGYECCEHFSNTVKVASSNTSCLEAHVGFFRLLIKGIFYPYVL